jgi:hypothetical protein
VEESVLVVGRERRWRGRGGSGGGGGGGCWGGGGVVMSVDGWVKMRGVRIHHGKAGLSVRLAKRVRATLQVPA